MAANNLNYISNKMLSIKNKIKHICGRDQKFNISDKDRINATRTIIQASLSKDILLDGALYFDLAAFQRKKLSQKLINQIQIYIDEYNWNELVKYQEWDQKEDLLIIRILKLSSGSMMLLYWNSPFDPWIVDFIETTKNIDRSDFNEINKIGKNQWKVL